jgi:RNA polymerase sigma factor (sigma-70 family)
MSLFPAVRQILAGLSGEDLARLSDAELLAVFAADRNEAAFAAIVERHGPAVLGVCRRTLGHVHDAEDAAQAVFLVLARNARRVRKPAALSAWLHGVAVRVSRKALARRRKAEPLPDSMPDAAAPDPTWADARSVIDASLAALPESLREPLVLCYLEGLTRDEAAARLGVSLDTFRGRLERGREKLRAALARRGFPLAAGLLAVLLESPARAAPAWSSATTATATGDVPPSPLTASLATGVLPVTRSILTRLLAVVCLGGIVVGVLVGQMRDGPPATVPPPVPEKLLVPDAKAPPVDKQFAGVWRSTITSPDGTTRTETLRFVDGRTLVWQVHQRSAGVDTSVLLRGNYVAKDGELVFSVTGKWAGEEPLTVRPDDANRKYKLVWSEDRAGFKLTNTDAAADSIWAKREFRAVKDDPAAAAVPAALRKIDRTIKKEPKYAGEPRYLLLAFGPEAKFLVWVVLDGTTLYVDRNGNGDLTDDGEKFDNGAVQRDPKGGVRSVAFFGIDLAQPDGTKHTNLIFSAVQVGVASTFVKIGVTVGGKTEQTAGLTNLRLGEGGKEAQLVHFGAVEVTARPSVSMPGHPDANAPSDFRVQVGTPGVGTGSFASFMNPSVAEGIGPVAEFEFEPLKAGDAARKVTLHLTERCCGDQFFAKLTVPEGVKTGVNAAKVMLSFPNCPWGKVEPAVYPVDVMPKRK